MKLLGELTPPHRAVVLREDLEHAVERRLQIEGARQRLADVEQRRQPAGLARVTSVRAPGFHDKDRFRERKEPTGE